jgi:hypothetical protein
MLRYPARQLTKPECIRGSGSQNVVKWVNIKQFYEDSSNDPSMEC